MLVFPPITAGALFKKKNQIMTKPDKINLRGQKFKDNGKALVCKLMPECH